MIKKMIFGGCSYTWGQSLHYYGGFGDDEHPKDGFYYADKLKPHHYQYNVDNRYPTLVADKFGRKPIVCAQNGGSNDHIVGWIYRTIKEIGKEEIDCVIFQTTSFARGYSHGNDEQTQIDMIEKLIDDLEDWGILIRFIHFDWEPGYMPDSVRGRTIKIDGNLNFHHTNTTGEPFDNRIVTYDMWETHQIRDSHFNLYGHRFIADLIVKDLLKQNYDKTNILEKPRLIENHELKDDVFRKVKSYYINNDSDGNYKQILLYNSTDEPVAYDIDYSDKKLVDMSQLDFLIKKDLLKMWMMVYPPNQSLSYHCDERNDFFRYVYEIQPSSKSFFEYIYENKFIKIEKLQNELLFIGDLIHRFVNESNSDTRISIVFDLKKEYNPSNGKYIH